MLTPITVIQQTKHYFITLNDSPLEALNIMSGLLAVVAICVTQPECPFNVPLSFNCSVILLVFYDG